MFSKVISFFDRSKRSKRFEFFTKNKNYEKKSMEWQDNDDDLDSFSWNKRNVFRKSKSNLSIIAIRDCNYQIQGNQISTENCNMPRKLISTFENLALNDDNDKLDEKNPSFVPNVLKDYEIYSQYDHNILSYGLKTQDITTKQLVIQGLEVLNFQGNKHSPEEIACYWKKDCRKWLWKAVRHSIRQNEINAALFFDENN